MGEPSDISRTALSLAEAGRVIDALDSAEEPGTPAADPAWPRIDGYILERELGRGASGVTYLAHKAGSESAAAIKIIRPHGPNGVASDRAWRELDLLQQARSPSVPRLLDFGRTGHSLYLVTEYIEGTPLDRLFGGQEPADGEGLRTRMQLLTRIGRAVQDLHERGVIHRDLKPSNIIVGPRGDPFIIDMGIAQLDTPDPYETLTLDGQTVGTPAFMAPEQARGLRETISTRSDVYGLGAVGYWLCTGQTPHDLTNATLHEAIRRVGTLPPRDPRAVSGTVPKPLAAVLAKACSPRPADRYDSASDLASDLDRWCARKPVLATRPGPWRRGARWIERHPVGATAFISVAMLGVSASMSLAVTKWLQQRPHHLVLTESSSGMTARVESIAGRDITEWDGPPKAFGAALSSRRPTTGAFAYAVLARTDRDSSSWRGSLCWYSAGDFTTPERVYSPVVPALLGGPEPTVATFAIQEDIYPDNAGDEVVAFHRAERGSATAVVVYGWNGETLSSTWHDGHLTSIRFFTKERVFVCVGVDSEREWSEYGMDQGPTYVHPMVVFAFRPVDIQPGSARRSDAKIEPVWSLAVYPPVVGDAFNWDHNALRSNPPLAGSDYFARVDLASRHATSCYASWHLRIDGSAHAIEPDDAYTSSALVPNRDSVELLPLHSLLPDRSH